MLSEHEIKAVRHPRILEFHKFFSEYNLWFEVGTERFRVRIRIYETNDGRFYFVQSHFVRTPIQSDSDPVAPSGQATPHLALSSAVESITTYYDGAVDAGHAPSFDWFVKNEHF